VDQPFHKKPSSTPVTPAKAVLFDADGVLWVGDRLIPGAAETIEILRGIRMTPYVVTNNPTNTRHEISAKFMAKGFHDVPDEMIVSAAYITTQYPLSLGFDDRSRRVSIVGEDGLIREMRQNAIEALGVNDFGDADFLTLKSRTISGGCRCS
jgi:HAD superfamily hydrolase (TIGR01450 family)